jgi:NADH:ubiquinone reductase (H+-translocating)
MNHRVVIIGGGFAGLEAAEKLADVPVEITLIDRRNFHLFQPLLYQVATGGLSPANIAVPLRAILSEHENVRVLLGEALGIDPARKCVVLADGEVEYDTLIVATGSRHHYFGNDQWEEVAPGLKTIEDALDIRTRLLLAFEAAERASSPEEIEAWLTFVIVGGGPTGVELAGAIAEVANQTLRHDFRRIDTTRARVLLVEALDRILPTYPPDLSEKAVESLGKLGAEVMTGAVVEELTPEEVTLKRGEERERIKARTTIWAAGVTATSLARTLQESLSAEADRAGRLTVGPDLSLPEHPEIFVVGDLALYKQDGKPLPGIAQVALQQGAYVATVIKNRLEGRWTKPFHFRSRGNLATIGRSSAVADLGVIHLHGFLGWLTWLFVHVFNLARFENRVLVMIQWAWNYITRNRSARLITGIRHPRVRSGGDS